MQTLHLIIYNKYLFAFRGLCQQKNYISQKGIIAHVYHFPHLLLKDVSQLLSQIITWIVHHNQMLFLGTLLRLFYFRLFYLRLFYIDFDFFDYLWSDFDKSVLYFAGTRIF